MLSVSDQPNPVFVEPSFIMIHDTQTQVHKKGFFIFDDQARRNGKFIQWLYHQLQSSDFRLQRIFLEKTFHWATEQTIFHILS